MYGNRKMKIGLVLASVPGYSETFFTNKIKGLSDEGHSVCLFTTTRGKVRFTDAKVIYGPDLSGGKLRQSVVSILALAKLLLISPTVAARFYRLERNNGASGSESIRRLIVNSHILPRKLDWLHFGFATMGIDRELVGKAIGAKVAVSFRGYDISVYPAKHPNCYIRLFAYIDKVHTISNGLLNKGYQIGLPETTKTTKISPAINSERFYDYRSSVFSGEIIKIITVARLHWIKGLEYTFEALALVQEAGIQFRYRIIGEGAELERLVFACHQLNLQDSVEFVGRLNHDEIPDILKSGDMYLQYSIQEGFCNSVLEAQAAGMLCIVSDAEGLSENVLDKQTGWVVPKRRPDLLSQKIIEVINMPRDTLLAISNTASERVQKEFNLEKQRREFVNFYKD